MAVGVSAPTAQCVDDVPMPIVKLNRWTLVLGIGAAVLLQQPWITTLLLLILIPAVLGGQRWSPIALIGRRLFARNIAVAEREDRRLMRFNNAIALILLGMTQIAFVLGWPLLGWMCALLVATAAAIALAGFCVGCFLYYQFKLNRYRLFGR